MLQKIKTKLAILAVGLGLLAPLAVSGVALAQSDLPRARRR